MGDFNTRIGNNNTKILAQLFEWFVTIMRENYIDFSLENNIKPVNTFFQQKNTHKYTLWATDSCSIIDYVTENQKTWD
jgi:hypothetical protein